MMLTDIFIKKPVLAISLNLFILCLGIFSCLKIPVRQYPELTTGLIQINTSYPGANAHTVAGFITSPLETAIANAEGIDYITSSSSMNLSQITAHLKLNTNPDTVLLEIMNKVQQISNILPKDALRPIVEKQSDAATPLLYISLKSATISPQKLTDYAMRKLQPQLNNLSGVAKIDILGGKKYALRIELDPIKLHAHRLSTQDISQALTKNQYISATGQIKNNLINLPLSTNTDLHHLRDFKELIIPCHDNSYVKLQDVAKVEFGSESYEEEARFDSQKAIFLAASGTPTANPLTVIKNIKKQLNLLRSNLPKGMQLKVVYDASQYINAALHEVIKTLIEAIIIVIVIMFLFLGSWRAVLIPLITIPLSTLGIGSILILTKCSINLLTLLALVLAIGLVVDDAIVVVENVHRHFSKNKNILHACLEGSREIYKAVIAMTITLSAIYLPMVFSTGITGTLFKEFAITLAGTVLLSGVIAISLSPWMNLKLLKHSNQHPIIIWFQSQLSKLEQLYFFKLYQVMAVKKNTWIFLLFAIILAPILYIYSAHEIAPEEDQGFFFVVSNPQSQANLKANQKYVQQIDNIFNKIPEMQHSFLINTATPFSGLILKSWNKRQKTQSKIKGPLQKELNKITGLKSFAIIPPALPGSGGGGAPFQIILESFGNLNELQKYATLVQNKAQDTGLFIFLNNTLKINELHYEIHIDREKAQLLGFDMQTIGQSLMVALAEPQLNYFSLKDKRYLIIPELNILSKLSPYQLKSINLINNQNQSIPLVNFIKIVPHYEPKSLNHFQQANSAQIEGVLMPGISIGEAVDKLRKIAKQTLPQSIQTDFGGLSRQFLQEESSLFPIFLLAVIMIYLVLAIQFNSFRDPLIILTSLPLTFSAALLPIFLGITSVNIYTQIGLLTLIGLISKHGILIVDFANQLQKNHSYDSHEAVIEAARLRLRPILMTTSAMIVGILPLLFATGAGSNSRFSIALVIVFGMSLGTIFTLFVVPCIYAIIHKKNVIQSISTINV